MAALDRGLARAKDGVQRPARGRPRRRAALRIRHHRLRPAHVRRRLLRLLRRPARRPRPLRPQVRSSPWPRRSWSGRPWRPGRSSGCRSSASTWPGPRPGSRPRTTPQAYALAHKNFLKKTVHAGEAYGPESIFQAITDLHADRLGHALHLFDAGMIKSPEIKDKKAYVANLVQFIADRRITIEVCLTSNLQTHPRHPPTCPSIRSGTCARPGCRPRSAPTTAPSRNTTVSDEILQGGPGLPAEPARAQELHHLRLQAELLPRDLSRKAGVHAPDHRLLREDREDNSRGRRAGDR
ncbi:MAG: hypothetical protein M0C28_45550 [Candidatus Moduliflexus flocculans]|nr:hypothetical protein [Candidatus Moduliflexus flocculans]